MTLPEMLWPGAWKEHWRGSKKQRRHAERERISQLRKIVSAKIKKSI